MANNSDKRISRSIWALLPWLSFAFVLIIIFALSQKIGFEKKRLSQRNMQSQISQKAAINVVVQEIIPVTILDKIDLPAQVKAWEDLLVSAEVTGLVIQIPVKEGQKVIKNQVLAQLDPRDYKARILSIQAKQELARITVRRQTALQNTGAVSQDELDQAIARGKELDAGLINAKLLLERCTIKAPMTGVINFLPAKVGLLLANGDPVAQLLKTDRLKVEVSIPEADVAAIRKLKNAKIIITSLDKRVLKGEKIFLSSQPSSAAMVYILRLAVDNKDGLILPGMFARTEIIKNTFKDSIAVPIFSVISHDEKQFVFVVEDNIAHKRPVTTGIFEAWKIQITDGLMPGDNVVIVGHRGLEEGQSVQVLKSVTDPEDIHR